MKTRPSAGHGKKQRKKARSVSTAKVRSGNPANADSSSTKLKEQTGNRGSATSSYPFSAIVGQEEMKLALVLNVIDPAIGGVLVMGHRGTGKSTAVRALAGLLPEINTVKGCPYHCAPADEQNLCVDCKRRVDSGEKLRSERIMVPVVDLPLGATEDRICGTIDIERALQTGVKAFEPGLLARANRGLLYIDEVNLLEDHLVDLLLDASVTGINRVERENISIEHPARFLLIGSGNPEEGELRPQLLDRFGLHVEVKTETDTDKRVEIVERRDEFEQNSGKFSQAFAGEQELLRRKIRQARGSISRLKVKRDLLQQIAHLCSELKVDGHRGELTIMRAARALAAFTGHKQVTVENVKAVTAMALRHRLRRDALEETPGTARVEAALEKVFSEANDRRPKGKDDNDGGRGTRLHVVSQAASPGGKSGADSKFQASLTPLSERARTELEIPEPYRLRESASKRTDTRRGKKTVVLDGRRGRYSGSTRERGNGARVAIDATLRAAAVLRFPTAGDRGFDRAALRYKRFARKRGTLFIFAIDASGSMALNRINQARLAILGLLRQSYINRDRVAIITFRGLGAEIMLPPSRSILRARQALDSVAIGGGTPLSAGVACALSIAKSQRVEDSRIVMLLFTDGRANVPAAVGSGNRSELIDREVKLLGAALKQARVTSVVVDTQNQFLTNDSARELAEKLAARYLSLSSSVKLV